MTNIKVTNMKNTAGKDIKTGVSTRYFYAKTIVLHTYCVYHISYIYLQQCILPLKGREGEGGTSGEVGRRGRRGRRREEGQIDSKGGACS